MFRRIIGGQSTWLQLLEPSKQAVLLEFIQSASMSVYRKWVADGKKIPLRDMIELSNQLLCSGVNGFIEHTMPL